MRQSMGWMTTASCVGASADFVDASRVAAVRLVADYCSVCPAIAECDRFASETSATVTGLQGVWAGRLWVRGKPSDLRPAAAALVESREQAGQTSPRAERPPAEPTEAEVDAASFVSGGAGNLQEVAALFGVDPARVARLLDRQVAA